MKYKKYIIEARKQINLTVPIFFAQIAMTTMGFVDMAMTGAVSVVDMAAVALGGSFWLPLTFFGQGMLRALHPCVAQLVGEGNLLQVRHMLFQGLFLALVFSIPLMLLTVIISYNLENMGMDSQLASISGEYLRAIMWGAPGLLFFTAMQCCLEGMGYTRPSVVAGFLGLLLNVLCNYGLIFGNFGLPAFGGVGAGIATAIVYWFMCFIILYFTTKVDIFAYFFKFKDFSIDFEVVGRLLRIGFPGALAMFIGVTSFVLVAVLVAPLGVIIVAGHQIAMNFGALLYMLPFSLSTTATIRTGYSLGVRSYAMVCRVSRVALLLGGIIFCVLALLTSVFRYEIAMIYNSNPEVLAIATNLLLFVAAYQCVDIVQVVTLGIIRGYNDTKAVFLIVLFSYGTILPIGYILGRTNWIIESMGVFGFWWAYIIGLSLAAILGFYHVRTLEFTLRRTLTKGIKYSI